MPQHLHPHTLPPTPYEAHRIARREGGREGGKGLFNCVALLLLLLPSFPSLPPPVFLLFSFAPFFPPPSVVSWGRGRSGRNTSGGGRRRGRSKTPRLKKEKKLFWGGGEAKGSALEGVFAPLLWTRTKAVAAREEFGVLLAQ